MTAQPGHVGSPPAADVRIQRACNSLQASIDQLEVLSHVLLDQGEIWYMGLTAASLAQLKVCRNTLEVVRAGIKTETPQEETHGVRQHQDTHVQGQRQVRLL